MCTRRVAAPGGAVRGPQRGPRCSREAREAVRPGREADARSGWSSAQGMPLSLPTRTGGFFRVSPPWSEAVLAPGEGPRQLLCPRHRDWETTGRRRSEAARQRPIFTPTYFSREHVLGATCAVLGGSLVPGAATATLTVTQSEFSPVCPHSLSPSLTPHGSALGCYRNAHVVGQWGHCTAGGPTWARAEVSADPLRLVALSFINSG